MPDPKLDLEKYVNGQDADKAPGPTVPVGSLVTFTYVVTNIGNVTLNDINVYDNMFVTPTNRLGLICNIPSLAPGESFTCTATSIAIAGQYMNIGKVSIAIMAAGRRQAASSSRMLPTAPTSANSRLAR